MFVSRLPLPLVSILVLLPACVASSPAPAAWQRSMDDVKRITYGAWTRVEGPSFASDGELLAADHKHLVLSRGSEVTIIDSRCVAKVTVAAFEDLPGQTILWGVLGSLSTFSHGAYLFLSMPVWLITTGSATYAHSKAGYLQADYSKPPAAEVDNIRKWARFPQGLPPGYLEQAKTVHDTGSMCKSFPPHLEPAPVPGPPARARVVPAVTDPAGAP